MSDIPQRLAAALADRYVLEREIGAGGMATVYLARDVRHKRSVAVKVVRPELGGRDGVERFLREIELAARPQAEYAGALLHLFRGQVREGRSRIARALAARDARPLPLEMRGLMEAVDGWGMMLQGDSVAGIRRLRAGIDTAASPGMTDETSFFRFQLGLALAARPETRPEGIRWLKYGFELQPLYLPLTQLALGRTYDAAGQPDSSAVAYRRFLRFWDKADPEMQARVSEAREALQEVTRERPGSR